jgi:hypothetical protein
MREEGVELPDPGFISLIRVAVEPSNFHSSAPDESVALR